MKKPEIVKVCMGIRNADNEIVQCDEILTEGLPGS